MKRDKPVVPVFVDRPARSRSLSLLERQAANIDGEGKIAFLADAQGSDLARLIDLTARNVLRGLSGIDPARNPDSVQASSSRVTSQARSPIAPETSGASVVPAKGAKSRTKAGAKSAKASKPQSRARPTEHLKLWPNGSVLRIKFLEGDSRLQARVMRSAAEWFEYANLGFKVLPKASKEAADIRIAFNADDGIWSAVGTDARNVPPEAPTMNLGWLTLRYPEKDFRRDVLTPFGHALGLISEHQNPNNRIDWDHKAVLNYFTGPPNNWTTEQTNANILRRYSFKPTTYRQFDPDSVMMYTFTNELFKSRRALEGGSDRLSVSDKQFIAQLYPREEQPPRPPKRGALKKK